MPKPFYAATVDGMEPLVSGLVIGAGGVFISPRSNTRTIQSANTGNIPVAGTPEQPPRTSGSSGCFIRKTGSAGWPAGNVHADWRTTGGGSFLRLTSPDLNGLRFELWNGASWVPVTATVPTTYFDAFHLINVGFTGLGTQQGMLRLLVSAEGAAGALIDETVNGLDLSHIANLASMRLWGRSGSSSLYVLGGEFYIQDEVNLTTQVYAFAPTADGTDATGSTGTFAAVDDGGSAWDSDFIALATSGSRKSLRAAARTFDGRTVNALGFAARMRSTDVEPQSARGYLKIGGLRYYSAPVLLTTSFNCYTFSWETNPVTGAPWTAAEAGDAALEWGVEIV